MKLSIIILAKNEADTIGACLEAIKSQTVFSRSDVLIEILVVANGCTDDTAHRACTSLQSFLPNTSFSYQVFDLPQGGKSRSWNRAVHEFADTQSDFMIFLDSDITLAGDTVLVGLVDFLSKNGSVVAFCGYPQKSTLLKPKEERTLLDHFSLKMSAETRFVHAISGALYAIRAAEVRKIWLPDETPGEDGFLNAMVKTSGFSEVEDHSRVRQSQVCTHYFEEAGASLFFSHERRMIVGTMINRWIFEDLHARKMVEPAGHLIAELNTDQPDWVQQIINRRIAGRAWLIPRELLFRRFKSPKTVGFARSIAWMPMAFVATLLTILPAIMANKILKEKGAASHW